MAASECQKTCKAFGRGTPIAEMIAKVGVTILNGVADDECILAKLRGMPHLVKFIFILATNEYRWVIMNFLKWLLTV